MGYDGRWIEIVRMKLIEDRGIRSLACVLVMLLVCSDMLLN
jgi:hypothetical protein